MNGKLFSLEDANALLPLVRSIAKDAVARYRASKTAIAALHRLRAQSDGSDLTHQERLIGTHLEELRRLVDELDQLGCRLRDYEHGVVDFPAACLDESGFVVYCWMLGEDQVAHWHGEHEGYADRQLIAVGASS